jgi:hypothetical protein
MSAVGDKVKRATGDGHTLSGVLLSTRGQGLHATAKVKLQPLD